MEVTNDVSLTGDNRAASEESAMDTERYRPYLQQHRTGQSNKEVRRQAPSEVRSLTDQCSSFVNSYFRYTGNVRDLNLQNIKLKQLNKSWKKWLRKNSTIYVFDTCRDMFFKRMMDLLDLAIATAESIRVSGDLPTDTTDSHDTN